MVGGDSQPRRQRARLLGATPPDADQLDAIGGHQPGAVCHSGPGPRPTSPNRTSARYTATAFEDPVGSDPVVARPPAVEDEHVVPSTSTATSFRVLGPVGALRSGQPVSSGAAATMAPRPAPRRAGPDGVHRPLIEQLWQGSHLGRPKARFASTSPACAPRSVRPRCSHGPPGTRWRSIPSFSTRGGSSASTTRDAKPSRAALRAWRRSAWRPLFPAVARPRPRGRPGRGRPRSRGRRLDELRLVPWRSASRRSCGSDVTPRSSPSWSVSWPRSLCASACGASSCSRSTGRSAGRTRSLPTLEHGPLSPRASDSTRARSCKPWNARCYATRWLVLRPPDGDTTCRRS